MIWTGKRRGGNNMSDSVGESGHDIAPVRDGETAMRQCPSCKAETTMRYRIKSSWFGLKKTEFWVCTRCGNTHDGQ